jgi:hypothetical protein
MSSQVLIEREKIIETYGKFKNYRERLKKPIRPFIDTIGNDKQDAEKEIRELFGGIPDAELDKRRVNTKHS